MTWPTRISSGSSSWLKSTIEPRSTFSAAAMSRRVSPATTTCSLPGSGTFKTLPMESLFGSSRPVAWTIASGRTSNCRAIWLSVSPAWTVYGTSRLRRADVAGDPLATAVEAGALVVPGEGGAVDGAGAGALAAGAEAAIPDPGTDSTAPNFSRLASSS